MSNLLRKLAAAVSILPTSPVLIEVQASLAVRKRAAQRDEALYRDDSARSDLAAEVRNFYDKAEAVGLGTTLADLNSAAIQADSSQEFDRIVRELIKPLEARIEREYARRHDPNPIQVGTSGSYGFGKPDEGREAQRSYPKKYRGHMVRVTADEGGGHKASVYRASDLRHTTKRHGDPDGAFTSAKVWIDDNMPVRETKEEAPRKKRKAQFGAGPGGRSLAYDEQPTDKFDPKKGFEWVMANIPGAGSIRSRLAKCTVMNDFFRELRRLPNSDELKIKAHRAFIDHCCVPIKKAQIGILPNPSDKSIGTADPELEQIRTAAAELQRKIADVSAKAQQYMDALANKAAAEISPDTQKLMGPGTLPSEGSSGGGLMALQQEAGRLQSELETRLINLPQNFIRFADGITYAKQQKAKLNDPAWGKMIEAAKERGKGAMKRVVTILDRISLLFAKLTTSVALKPYAPGELDAKTIDKLTKKNVENGAKIDQYQLDQQDIAPTAQRYFLDEAQGRIQKPHSAIRTAQTEVPEAAFDLLQELIDGLGDASEDIQYVNQNLEKATGDIQSVASQQEAFPLPDADEEEGQLKAAQHKFSLANKGGLRKIQRSAAKRLSFSPKELREAQTNTRDLVERLNELEKQIENRESHYYSAQEAVADGPLIQQLMSKANELRSQLKASGYQAPLGEKMLANLRSQVEAYVDENVGLEGISINVEDSTITVASDHPGVPEEWVDMANELLDDLARDGWGKYTVVKTTPGGFTLSRTGPR